jgi:hypothetical protein
MRSDIKSLTETYVIYSFLGYIQGQVSPKNHEKSQANLFQSFGRTSSDAIPK